MLTRLRTIVLAVGLMAPGAMAGSVYSSLSDWTSSSPGNLSVVDFESTSPAYFSSSLTLSPFTFSATGGLYVLNGAASSTGSGHFLTTLNPTALNITLAAGVYGLAFNLGDDHGAGQLASIVAVDANGIHYTTSGILTASPAAFWGLRNDVALVSVTITFTTGITPQIDNVRYSNVALSSGTQTPEAGSIFLLLAGFGLMVVRRCVLFRDAQDHGSEPHE